MKDNEMRALIRLHGVRTALHVAHNTMRREWLYMQKSKLDEPEIQKELGYITIELGVLLDKIDEKQDLDSVGLQFVLIE